MKNLNKENFFNAMAEKYPEAMQLFCDWIDAYKASINWVSVFNGTTEEEMEAFSKPMIFAQGNVLDFEKASDHGKIIIIGNDEETKPSISYISGIKQAPKFHDIPFELQFGVLYKFISLFEPGIKFVFDIEKMKEHFEYSLKGITAKI